MSYTRAVWFRSLTIPLSTESHAELRCCCFNKLCVFTVCMFVSLRSSNTSAMWNARKKCIDKLQRLSMAMVRSPRTIRSAEVHMQCKIVRCPPGVIPVLKVLATIMGRIAYSTFVSPFFKFGGASAS
jgi:hypothetical protein